MSPDLRLDTQLCFALYSASRKVTSAYWEPLKQLGLTYPQYLVLLALWETDHRTVNQLGEALMLDSGTLSPLLRRMENGGFVSRARSATDERSVVISLTPKSRGLEKEAARIHTGLLDSLDMSTEERMTLQRLAQQLCRVL